MLPFPAIHLLAFLYFGACMEPRVAHPSTPTAQDYVSVHVHSLPKHARLLCPLHHPLSVGHHQPQHHFSNQAEVAVGRIPTGECVGDGVPCGMGERGVVEVARWLIDNKVSNNLRRRMKFCRGFCWNAAGFPGAGLGESGWFFYGIAAERDG